MHAKHDYNPLKTAYPIESIPDFDTEEYPESSVGREAASADATSQTSAETADDRVQSAEDFALLEKSQQAAFHQSKDFQGAQAYRGQQYEPSNTELESTVSWTLLIGCSILLLLLLLIGGGIFSLFISY